MNEFYTQKAGIPREVKNAPSLREAVRMYTMKRLLHVADVCRQHSDDSFRKEFGIIHHRYANMLFIVTEAVQDVEYLTKSVITWMEEDFKNALTGAQREAAGVCASELTQIVQHFKGE
jgi:hypothetical protein